MCKFAPSQANLYLVYHAGAKLRLASVQFGCMMAGTLVGLVPLQAILSVADSTSAATWQSTFWQISLIAFYWQWGLWVFTCSCTLQCRLFCQQIEQIDAFLLSMRSRFWGQEFDSWSRIHHYSFAESRELILTCSSIGEICLPYWCRLPRSPSRASDGSVSLFSWFYVSTETYFSTCYASACFDVRTLIDAD